MRLLLTVLVATLVAGCAGAVATKYQPKDWTGGYSDFCINDNTYRVSFDGNAYVTRSTVADYATLRCAELALEHGFRYFKLFNEKDFSVQQQTSTPGVVLGTVSPVQSGAVGVATTLGGGSQTLNKPAVSFFMIGYNEKPDGTYYDARLVSESLRETYGLN